VRAGDANGLAVITQVQPITAIFTIPQDNLPAVLKRIQTGERLPVEAFDRDQKTKLADGVLLTVDNQIDTTTGTVKLKAQFPNDDAKLFPNRSSTSHAGRHAAGHHHRLHGGDTARHAGHFRVRRGERLHRGAAAGEAGRHGGNRVRGGIRLEAGRAGRGRRTDRLREGAKVELTNREAGKPAPYSSEGGGRKGGRRKKVERQRGERCRGQGRREEGGDSGAEKKGGDPGAEKKSGSSRRGEERRRAGTGKKEASPAHRRKRQPGGEATGERKRYRDMSDDEKAAAKKRFESLTDEEREKLRRERQEKRKSDSTG
jgi:multidrug efflux system membrane fusion protein